MNNSNPTEVKFAPKKSKFMCDSNESLSWDNFSNNVFSIVDVLPVAVVMHRQTFFPHSYNLQNCPRNPQPIAPPNTTNQVSTSAYPPQCDWCDHTHACGKVNCPANGKLCECCGTFGHVSAVCSKRLCDKQQHTSAVAAKPESQPSQLLAQKSQVHPTPPTEINKVQNRPMFEISKRRWINPSNKQGWRIKVLKRFKTPLRRS